MNRIGRSSNDQVIMIKLNDLKFQGLGMQEQDTPDLEQALGKILKAFSKPRDGHTRKEDGIDLLGPKTSLTLPTNGRFCKWH